MIAVTIPTGRYAVFNSDKGPVMEVVPAVWQKIWSTPGERSFNADYELYDERSMDPQNAEVTVFVGVENG